MFQVDVKMCQLSELNKIPTFGSICYLSLTLYAPFEAFCGLLKKYYLNMTGDPPQGAVLVITKQLLMLLTTLSQTHTTMMTTDRQTDFWVSIAS